MLYNRVRAGGVGFAACAVVSAVMIAVRNAVMGLTSRMLENG